MVDPGVFARYEPGTPAGPRSGRQPLVREAPHVWYFASANNRASLDLHTRLGFIEVARDFWFPGLHFTGGEGVRARVDPRAGDR